MKPTRKERLRAALNAALDEYRILLVLARMFGPEERAQHDANVAAVDALTVSELGKHLTRASQACAKARRALKTRVPGKELRALMYDFLDGHEGRLLFLPKYILRALAPTLIEEVAGFSSVPEGARISLDVYGQLPRGHAGELRILEAALFEDMALHFNRAVSLEEEEEELARSDIRRLSIAYKIPWKARWASLRAAVTSAFFMLEAYLNSIAFDHLVLNGEQVSEKNHILLSEWEYSEKDGGRQRFVSFRNKLLQYPRIILGQEHPPLQETNCEPMRIVLEHARDLRDAVVHPNSRIHPVDDVPDKEIAFMSMDRSVAEEVVDSAIELVAAVETTIHGSEERLFWLARRGTEGTFAPEVFF